MRCGRPGRGVGPTALPTDPRGHSRPEWASNVSSPTFSPMRCRRRRTSRRSSTAAHANGRRRLHAHDGRGSSARPSPCLRCTCDRRERARARGFRVGGARDRVASDDEPASHASGPASPTFARSVPCDLARFEVDVGRIVEGARALSGSQGGAGARDDDRSPTVDPVRVDGGSDAARASIASRSELERPRIRGVDASPSGPSTCSLDASVTFDRRRASLSSMRNGGGMGFTVCIDEQVIPYRSLVPHLRNTSR